MRNLKRALSLTLASVMLLGMMVVGSSAAAGYDDVDEKNNIEAIEVLQTIEVMVGDERGFGPDRPVNRAEMAVVMGKLLDLDYNYYATSCPFNDVYDWARGWVGACYANKIVSGRGDGVYDPGATVTAVEASSMLMRALGYFQYANDVADGFELATVRQGTKIGIYDGVGSSATEPMTRDQVAQMVLNALQSGMVEPDGNTINLTTPDGTVFTGKVNYVFRTSAKDFANAIGKVGATSIGSTNEGWIVELGEQLYNGDLKLYDDRTDDFGRPSRKWEYDGKAIGTYMKKELIKQEYTNEVKGKDLYDLLGSDTIKTYDLEVTIDGVNVADEKTVMDTKAGSYFDATHMAKTWKAKVGQTGKGVLTQVFVDPDWNNGKGKIWVSVINTYLAKATGDYNDKKDEIKLDVYGLAKDGKVYYKYYDKAGDKLAAAHSGKDYEILTAAGEDFSKVIDMKKDDIVLVTVASGDIKTVADPEVLSAVELSEFSKNKYVVSDSKYEYNTTIDYDPEVLEYYTAEGTNGNQELKDTEYNLFLDPYGYLIGVEVVEAVKNYIFLTGIDQGNSNLNAKTSDAAGILTDGTFVNFRMNMKDSKTVTTGNNPVKTVNLAGQNGTNPGTMTAGKFQGHALWNTWCTYTVDKDGTYTLTEVGDFASTKAAKPAKAGQYADLTTVSKEIGTKRVSLLGDTNKYVYGNDDSVYILAELKEVNSKNTIYEEFKIAGGAAIGGGNDFKPDTPVIVISGVDSVETGVDNVKIKTFAGPSDIQKAADNSTAAIYPGYIYTLFDKDGYIIASVLLGEDDGTSKNLVYSHKSSVESEKYNKDSDDWTWTRYVIKDGEETLLTQTGSKVDPDNSIYLMKENTWYEVTYKADGSVKSVEYAYFYEGGKNVGVNTGTDNHVSGPALDPAYINAVTEEGDFVNHIEFLEDALNNDKTTVLYEEVWGKFSGNKEGGTTYGDGAAKDAMPEKNEPSLKGSTLYVDTDASKGFYVSSDVKSVLIQKNNGEKTTTYGAGTSDLEGMLRDLNFAGGTYLFKISAILVNGRATVVIIHDWNETTATPGGGNGGNGGGDEDGLGIDPKPTKLIYKYYDSEFDVKDWKTIREDAANAAAAYYGVGLAAGGNTITTVAPANGNGTGYTVRLDDGSLKGEAVTVDIQRMVKITKDGAFVAYTPADGATNTTAALGSGNYIKGAANVKVNNGTQVTGNQTVQAAAAATDADVAFTTAYKVTFTSLDASSTVRLKGVNGAPGALTDEDWVVKDTTLVVTGTTTGDDLVHQLVATDNGGDHNVGAAKVVATGGGSPATDAATGEFTVSNGNVAFTETTGYTVKVPGKTQVLAAGDKITFNAPNGNADYAAKKNVTDGHYTGKAAGAITKIGTMYEYTVSATDAHNGVIELVQVAKVTLTTSGNFTAADTKFAKGSETPAQLTSAHYYEVGVVLTLVGDEAATADNGQVIVVKQPSTGTAVKVTTNSVAEAGNGASGTKASATYTIQSTDYDLNFDKAADPS